MTDTIHKTTVMYTLTVYTTYKPNSVHSQHIHWNIPCTSVHWILLHYEVQQTVYTALSYSCFFINSVFPHPHATWSFTLVFTCVSRLHLLAFARPPWLLGSRTRSTQRPSLGLRPLALACPRAWRPRWGSGFVTHLHACFPYSTSIIRLKFHTCCDGKSQRGIFCSIRTQGLKLQRWVNGFWR